MLLCGGFVTLENDVSVLRLGSLYMVSSANLKNKSGRPCGPELTLSPKNLLVCSVFSFQSLNNSCWVCVPLPLKKIHLPAISLNEGAVLNIQTSVHVFVSVPQTESSWSDVSWAAGTAAMFRPRGHSEHRQRLVLNARPPRLLLPAPQDPCSWGGCCPVATDALLLTPVSQPPPAHTLCQET